MPCSERVSVYLFICVCVCVPSLPVRRILQQLTEIRNETRHASYQCDLVHLMKQTPTVGAPCKDLHRTGRAIYATSPNANAELNHQQAPPQPPK